MIPQTYHTRKAKPTVIGITMGFLILLVSTVLPLVLPSEEPLKWHWSMGFAIIFVGFFYVVMISSLLRLFTRFEISNRGILIRPMLRPSVQLSAHDIASVELVTAEDYERLTADMMNEEERIAKSADLIGYVQLIKRKSPEYKYLSVTPVVATISSGNREAIHTKKVRVHHDICMITLKDGNRLFISPKNERDFVDTARKLGLTDGQ
ncbi:MAG: hypothetical protein KDD36_08640 [Flavobacteriales bacterium]|nr:hypothetical protein [Flavobacteriales bacterium]